MVSIRIFQSSPSRVGAAQRPAPTRRDRRPSFCNQFSIKRVFLFALIDFYDLVCDAAVGLTVYGLSRFFARSSAQTKYRAFCFVEPVMQILHPMLALNRKVLLVAICSPCSRQSFHTSVNVHIKWHLCYIPFLLMSCFRLRVGQTTCLGHF